MEEPLSSPSSLSSCGSEAVNSASARVYMGPRLPLEDKFDYMLSPVKPGPSFSVELQTPQPITPPKTTRSLANMACEPGRITDVSSLVERDSLEEEDGWQAKMVEDFWEGDEPSSAIATRILRAHDNPSPPPRLLGPSEVSGSSSPLTEKLALQNSDTSKRDSDALEDDLLHPSNEPQNIIQQREDILLSDPYNERQVDVILPKVRDTSLQVPEGPEPERDLISFDHSIILTASHEDSRSTAESSRHVRHTIDDLLFSSPVQITQELRAQESDQLQAGSSLGSLQIPNLDTPRRRSPRLSAISPRCLLEQGKQDEPTHLTKASPYNFTPGSSRKRRREDTEKLIRLTPSPIKVTWPNESDMSESDSQTPSRNARRERKRLKKGNDDDFCLRLTESLSPDSAQILSSLIIPSQVDEDIGKVEDRREGGISPDQPEVVHAEASNSSTPSHISVSNSSNSESSNRPQRPPPVQTTSFMSGAFSSRLLSSSPAKPTISVASDDPNRTPARRVPVFMAPGSSDNRDVRLRALQAAGVYAGHTPVFTRPPPDDPNRSPARRVPIPETARQEQARRNKSAQPRSRLDAQEAQKLTSVAQSGAPVKIATVDGTGAPDSSSGNATIPTPNPTLPPKSDSKSTSITLPKGRSRIPRVSSIPKPSTLNRTSRLPMPSSKKTGCSPLPRTQPSSPIKEQARIPPQIQQSSGSEDSVNEVDGSQLGSRPSVTNRGKTPVLKHARGNEKGKAAQPQPLVKMRQVIPGMFGGPVPDKSVTLTGIEKEAHGQADASSPVKPAAQQKGPIKVREVVKGTLQNFELKTTSFKALEALAGSRAKVDSPGPEAAETAEQDTHPCPTLDTFTFSCPVSSQVDDQMEMEVEPSASPLMSSALVTGPPFANARDISSVQSASEPEARRSSRTRRTVQNSDVFGPVSAGPSKPKRKSATGDLFLRNNGFALRTLTNSNTALNQQYHTQLEVLTVRKSGNRPESPTLKLRTIQEKQKEEQGKMRAERARRRRGGEDVGDSSFDSEMHEITMEIAKHRRGPGEDEDYESPIRPDNGRKGVKWDRGLEAVVFLDEIEVRPRRQQDGQSTEPRKGCLRVSRNVTASNNYGNTANAASLELPQEKVVVTKFVYDNDEEALVEQPRSTRSKAKRGR